MKISIVYLTNRKNPCIDWFFNTLHRECGGDYECLDVIVVDFYAGKRIVELSVLAKGPVRVVPPKPNIWQGDYRIYDQDYFAASNARNTGILYATGEAIAFVDDVSALCPGWLNNVRHAAEHGYVLCGAYQKMNDIAVSDDGLIVSSTELTDGAGRDSRWGLGSNDGIVKCDCNQMYGCSFVVRTSMLLAVNGLDEACDGICFEDVCLGFRLKNAGAQFYYNQNCKTIEDAAMHGEPNNTPIRRINRPIAGFADLHWKMLAYVCENTLALGNDFIISDLRQHVQSGGEPPKERTVFKWDDGQPTLLQS